MLQLSGGLTYYNSGSLTSGAFMVSPSTGTPVAVSGTVSIPGVRGGSATATISVIRIFGIYVGTVHVVDPGAGLDTTAIVLTPSLTRVGVRGVSGSAIGPMAQGRDVRPYLLRWTVNGS